MCSLFVAGSGGPASRARCGAPHLFLWPPCLSALLGPLRAGGAPLSLAVLAVPRCLGAVLWLFFSASRCWLFVRLVCVSRLAVGCSLVVSPPPPFPFCVSRFSLLLLGALVFCSFFFFFSLLPLCAPVVSGFLWFPAPGALGLGALRCLLCWPSASRLSVRLSLFRAFRLAGGCSPVVAAPPPPFCLAVFVAAARCCVPCAVLCCASPGAVLRRAAARCVLRCCAVLCCVVLVGCRCLLRRALWRCPLPWGPVLCGAVFCGVPPCCVCFVVARWCVLLFAVLLCAVCVPGCCAVRSLSSPLCAVLCFAVLVRSCCAVRVVPAVAGVWCCGVPSCGAGSGGPWFSAGGVFRCRCPCLAAWSVSLVAGAVCCGALLSCVVFSGAVLSRGALLLCSAVVLRCCWGLLCAPVGCRAVLCCAVGWLCCFLPGGGVCTLWCSFPRAVRSLSSPFCALRCLVVLAVVPCFPVSCAVALCCRVVLCCRAPLSFCGAVCVGCGLWAVVLCCVVLLVGCAVFCPVVVSACCGALFLVLCVPCLLRSVRCGALLPCAVPRGAVLPPGAVVSCPAALLGVFLAWVWLYLLEKPLQNFVKYFFPLFFFFLAFENKIKLYTTQHTRVQQDHVRCCALRATRRS